MIDLELALQRRGHLEEFRRKHRTGLLTLVFSDIVGSTRLEHALDALSARRPRGRKLDLLQAVATLNDPVGSLFVARFRRPDSTSERIPPAAGEKSGHCSRTAEPFVPWPVR